MKKIIVLCCLFGTAYALPLPDFYCQETVVCQNNSCNAQPPFYWPGNNTPNGTYAFYEMTIWQTVVNKYTVINARCTYKLSIEPNVVPEPQIVLYNINNSPMWADPNQPGNQWSGTASGMSICPGNIYGGWTSAVCPIFGPGG